ncbi:nucleotidyltransferase family protein [Clostridium psychrophilum]|uniref:nucleotidyltransferase family protein n=1 Tax=Clostridium psychrophilum TaxID=132926 RepID=UPI001C0ACC62|nr:nucleotidyltransferase family protein [Clostridium psychrophilum]MBU3181568.1 nucleotidyltransferase family protein [Clostridium psychrophilum]
MDISKILINKEISIRDAIEKLDKSTKRIALIMEDNKLVGVVTDGDIRRWILKNGDLSYKVELIMNHSPIVLTPTNIHHANEIMMNKHIEAIPIVDENKEVVDIVFWNDLYHKKFNYTNINNIAVVIMAGGKGTRLKPYTTIIPKGLLPIGDIPIVERIINKFLEYNFNDYYLTINYKKEIVKAYFNEAGPYNISFIEESKPLGTAGSLSLLRDTLKNCFFVTNCDILVNTNYSKVVEYHKKHNYKITVVVALKDYIIPYGVFKLNESGKIDSLMEKPKYEFLVNIGMYLLEPEVLKYIPENTYFDMTELITRSIEEGESVGVYPVSDNDWLDMGEFKSMENMVEKLNI